MAAKTKVSWALNSDGTPGDSFNPWVGCEPIGPGCDNCYARAWAIRAGRGELWEGQRDRTVDWTGPVKWNRQAAAAGIRRRVFCGSLCDIFDNKVPAEWRVDLWRLIRATPNLDWIIVTKRIGNAAAMLPDHWGPDGYPNFWLLSTVTDQREFDRDVPRLLRIPAAVLGVSIEPMLGPIDMGITIFDWVIVGAESGARQRRFDEDWARILRDDCQAAGVPFFYKQRPGGSPPKRVIETPELDGRRWVEMPDSGKGLM